MLCVYGWWGFKFCQLHYCVEQGYPLSPTLFGLCIDEVDQMVAKFVNEESVEEVAIGM